MLMICWFGLGLVTTFLGLFTILNILGEIRDSEEMGIKITQE